MKFMNTILTQDKNCNVEVELQDGNKINVFANQLFDKELHHWKGWECNAGMDGIYIFDDFTVYSGNCKNDLLGNLFDDNFKLFNKPTICKRETCTSCTSDLYMTKLKKQGE
jgi:hypothetical protein